MWQNLDKAIELIKEAAAHINEAIRRRERRDKLRALERNWIGKPGLVDLEARLPLCSTPSLTLLAALRNRVIAI